MYPGLWEINWEVHGIAIARVMRTGKTPKNTPKWALFRSRGPQGLSHGPGGLSRGSQDVLAKTNAQKNHAKKIGTAALWCPALSFAPIHGGIMWELLEAYGTKGL